MENKGIKRSAAELNDDALENVSGGAGDYETVTVSGVPCSRCGEIINGTAHYYPDSGLYVCTSNAHIRVIS